MHSSVATLFVLVTALACGAETEVAPQRLKVGIVQMATRATLNDNRDRILSGVSEAAARGVRVAVFPEGALGGQGCADQVSVDAAVSAIRRAARERNVYVLFGACTYSPALKQDTQWMLAIGPDGDDLFRYEKLYDNHRAAMPDVFNIDGIPCSAMICADRWLRGVAEIPIQRGARISFELSSNFASEWVAPFEWYWYVPHALRNNVWVVFANTANRISGTAPTRADLRHGHSAVIAPDGRLLTASHRDTESIVVADLDVSQATRAEALARAAHPALGPFWEAGLKLQSGQKVQALSFKPIESKETEITIAAAQVASNLDEMEAMICEARARSADLIAFPERAVSANDALERLQRAARENRITVAFGMPHRVDGRVRNSAFVLGRDGSVLTRYDQLSATTPYEPGADPASMWFSLKDVPAVVTIGRDALWTELAELAAVAGAKIHVHLDHDSADEPNAGLRRLQIWSNLASFLTFSATVNVVGSAIWDDLRGVEETRAEVHGLSRPDSGAVEVYSPFSANLVVCAGSGRELIVATRRVPRLNPHHPSRTSNLNPQMEAWYNIGARIVYPRN